VPALLVGTGSASYLAFAGVVIVLAAVGIIASALPARRAMRIDPVVALQAE
jgi:ABC-type antimicrobial peptide transport system permease subunit